MVGIGVVSGFLQGLSDSVKQNREQSLNLRMLEQRKQEAEARRLLLEKDIQDTDRRMQMETEQLNLQRASAFLSRSDQEMGLLGEDRIRLMKEMETAEAFRQSGLTDDAIRLKLQQLDDQALTMFRNRAAALSGLTGQSALQTPGIASDQKSLDEGTTSGGPGTHVSSSKQVPQETQERITPTTSGAATSPPAEPRGSSQPPLGEGLSQNVPTEIGQQAFSPENLALMSKLGEEETVREALSDMPGVRVLGGVSPAISRATGDILRDPESTLPILAPGKLTIVVPDSLVTTGVTTTERVGQEGSARTGNMVTEMMLQKQTAGRESVIKQERDTALLEAVRSRLKAKGIPEEMAASYAIIPESAYVNRLQSSAAEGDKMLKQQISQLMPEAKFEGDKLAVSQHGTRESFDKMVQSLAAAVDVNTSMGDPTVAEATVNAAGKLLPELEGKFIEIGEGEGWLTRDTGTSWLANPFLMNSVDVEGKLNFFQSIRAQADPLNLPAKAQVAEIRLPTPSEYPDLLRKSLTTVKPTVGQRVGALVTGVADRERGDLVRDRWRMLRVLKANVHPSWPRFAQKQVAEILKDDDLWREGFGSQASSPAIDKLRDEILGMLKETRKKAKPEQGMSESETKKFLEGMRRITPRGF